MKYEISVSEKVEADISSYCEGPLSEHLCDRSSERSSDSISSIDSKSRSLENLSSNFDFTEESKDSFTALVNQKKCPSLENIINKSPDTPLESVVLRRSRGSWRDGGFFDKIVTPGGSKAFKRRRGDTDSSEEVTLNKMGLDKESKVRSSQAKFDQSLEKFTDDWQTALGCKEENDIHMTNTLPRNYKCSPALHRQSLPAAKIIPFQRNSPVSALAKSPYLYFKSKMKSRAARLSCSPLRTSPNRLKNSYQQRISALNKNVSSQSVLEQCPLSDALGYHLKGTSPSVCSHCSLICNSSTATLPRAGLTRMPPTPPSPRRQPSWWSRLSTTTRELQTLTSKTMSSSYANFQTLPTKSLTNSIRSLQASNLSLANASRTSLTVSSKTLDTGSSSKISCMGPPSISYTGSTLPTAGALLHGPDVTIQWVS